MPEGSKERGVGLSGSLENVANVEKLIFEKLNARRLTSLAPSPAEVCSRGSWAVIVVTSNDIVVASNDMFEPYFLSL